MAQGNAAYWNAAKQNGILQSTGVEDQKLLCLVQDNFLTQHVLEPTRATRVLDIVLFSQKEVVDNVVIQEPGN